MRDRGAIEDDFAEDSVIVHRVFLIGDAGQARLNPPEPNLISLRRHAAHDPLKSTVIFLGDNIYPSGMPAEVSPERRLAERRLSDQITVVEESGAQGIFVPGNHDWGGMAEHGLESVRRQEEFLQSRRNPRLRMLPPAGTPGPAFIDVGSELRLIVLDTHWWLHKYSKVFYPGVLTEEAMHTAIQDSLTRLLRTAGTRIIIVVGHHPLTSHGPHAGFFDWKDHLFPLRNLVGWLYLPLPIIGEIYPIARSNGLFLQDMSSGKYKRMKEFIASAFNECPPLVYAAGHEHALEVIKGSEDYFQLVSGFGVAHHDSPLTTSHSTIFAYRHPGFMKLEVTRYGRVRLGVITPLNDGEQSSEVYSVWLK